MIRGCAWASAVALCSWPPGVCPRSCWEPDPGEPSTRRRQRGRDALLDPAGDGAVRPRRHRAPGRGGRARRLRRRSTSPITSSPGGSRASPVTPGSARRDRPGDRAHPDRHRRHRAGLPPQPRRRRAGVHDARAAQPRAAPSSASAPARRSTSRPAGWTGRSVGEQVERMEEALRSSTASSTASASTTTGATSAPSGPTCTRAPSAGRRSTSRRSARAPRASPRAWATGSGRSPIPSRAPGDHRRLPRRLRRRRQASPARSSCRPASPTREDDDAGARGRARLEGRPSRPSTSPTTGTTRRRCTSRPSGEVSDERVPRGVHPLVGPRRARRPRARGRATGRDGRLPAERLRRRSASARSRVYGEHVLPALRGSRVG